MTSQQRLAGKTAIIAGGTTGLGYETARHYLDEGAKVLITGRNQEKVDQAVAALGEGAHGFAADVQNLSDLAALAEHVKEHFGAVDVLFANAGLGVFAPIEEISEEDYDRQFDTNVKGVFFTVQKLLPHLKEGASVILTASAVHEKGTPTGSIYFATKAAVRSLARSLAAELGPRRIRVNSISPGIVRTHFSANSNVGAEGFDGFIDQVVTQVPLAREGKADEIAKAALFLASDEASYMTAADLVVDGGFMGV